MIKLLYGLLIFAVALDAIASILAAWYIFRLRQRMGWYLALALTGVAAEAVIGVITVGVSSAPQQITVWIVVVRIAVRLFKAVTMAMLPLYLLGYINGDKRNDQ
jgi:heme A synthase